MKIHPNLTLDVVTEAVEADDSLGFCIACGAEHYGVEPDAQRYKCEECDLYRVYGAEEILLYLA